LPREKNPEFPFCSARCKAVDLGKWLGEEYRVPAGHADVEDEPTAPAPHDYEEDESLS
jgi:endogenous inhibitor of DNA gyrase (YacG/DUF329 family)